MRPLSYTACIHSCLQLYINSGYASPRQVAGDREGISAFQLDIKCEGLSLPLMREALEQVIISLTEGLSLPLRREALERVIISLTESVRFH